MKSHLIRIFCLLFLTASTARGDDARTAKTERPNIIVILADDLGYGDVHCLNLQRGKIATPRLDKLAADGMTFSDAHSSSSVCTPTRYGLLTGRYNWRSRLQRGVLVPWDPPLIAKDRLTLPAMLKAQGYATACIGKWHLGWNWPGKGDKVDFTQPIGGGPTELGFDNYFGTDVPNYPPYCFIDNDHTLGIPSVPLPPEYLKNNQASRPGLALPDWKLEEILPTITDKACDFVRSQTKSGQPFFLYFPLTAPHTPLSPTDEWKGKSGLGTYADFVMETDAMVGKLLDVLEESGAAANTLVVFTSDNGCAPYIGVSEMEAKGHFPSADRRGYKADAWDGGHHVPFIVRWPGQVKAGTHCDQLICLNDLMASCAAITSAKIPETAAEDSISLLPLLKGEDKPVRDTLVHHSINGVFAIREGKWKLVLCPGSGGWSPSPQSKDGKPPAFQLYNLSADPGEQRNLQDEHPEIVARLRAELEKIIAEGRSTPGPKLQNDVPVKILK